MVLGLGSNILGVVAAVLMAEKGADKYMSRVRYIFSH